MDECTFRTYCSHTHVIIIVDECVRKYMVHKSAQNNKITAAFRNDKDFAHPYTHVFTYLYYVQESGL